MVTATKKKQRWQQEFSHDTRRVNHSFERRTDIGILRDFFLDFLGFFLGFFPKKCIEIFQSNLPLDTSRLIGNKYILQTDSRETLVQFEQSLKN